jgi:hypothetical protein
VPGAGVRSRPILRLLKPIETEFDPEPPKKWLHQCARDEADVVVEIAKRQA